MKFGAASHRHSLSFVFGSVGAVMLTASVVPSVRAQSRPFIASLRVVRQVQVSRDVIAAGTSASYQDARNGQGLFAGQGLRTLRRSQAEVTFGDKSVLRVGERTDMVLQETATLRRLQMQTGLVWIRVRKGTQTQVETPSATAVARGTEFTVQYDGGVTVLTVFEGTVEMQSSSGLVSVTAGQRYMIAADGTATAPVSLPYNQMPIEYGGGLDGWWNTTGAEAGVATLAGSSLFQDLRTTTIAEAIQQVRGVQNFGPSRSRNRFTDAEQDRLLQIAQATLVPDFRASGTTLVGYRDTFGANALATRFGTLSPSDAQFLASKNLVSVGDFLSAVQQSGASANVGLSTRALSAAAAPLSKTRAYYRPESITGTPNYDLRLLDPNESSDTVLGIGVLASLLVNAIQRTPMPGAPQIELSGFGLAADTSLGGARARVSGRVGQTRYRLEANVVHLFNFDERSGPSSSFNFSDRRTSARLASVAVVEQTVAPGVTVFAGRRRFYHGPAFQNQNLSQLIADRYSGAGVTVQRGLFTLDGGWAYDTNPVVKGAQNGAVGSVFMKAYGGQFGVHYLRVPKLSGGNGVTVSASLPVLPNRLDFYTEVGRGPDKANLQTYGVYFPGVFQKYQTDVFVEYGSHQGVGHSLTITGSRDTGKNFTLRSYVDLGGYEGTRAGIAGIVRFGN